MYWLGTTTASPEMEVGVGEDTGFLFSHFFNLIWYTDQTGCPWYSMETYKEWNIQASSNIAAYTYFSSFIINNEPSLAHMSQLEWVGMVKDIVRLPLKASGVWLLLSDRSSLFQLHTLWCSALVMLTFSPVLPNFHNLDSCSWNDVPLPPYPVNTYAVFRCHLGITAQRHLSSAPRQEFSRNHAHSPQHLSGLLFSAEGRGTLYGSDFPHHWLYIWNWNLIKDFADE